MSDRTVSDRPTPDRSRRVRPALNRPVSDRPAPGKPASARTLSAGPLSAIASVGDILVMKKAHPCGSCEWEVLRAGADLRLRCRGCGREVTLSRSDARARTKILRHKAAAEE